MRISLILLQKWAPHTVTVLKNLIQGLSNEISQNTVNYATERSRGQICVVRAPTKTLGALLSTQVPPHHERAPCQFSFEGEPVDLLLQLRVSYRSCGDSS